MNTLSFLFTLSFIFSAFAQNKPLNLNLPDANKAAPPANGGSAAAPKANVGWGNGMSWQEEQEQKRRQRKIKCVEFFKKNLARIDSKDVSNYCANESVARAVNDEEYQFNSAQYIQCANINHTLIIPEDLYINDCAVGYKINPMLMERFPSCVAQLSPDFGKLPSYRACQDGTFLSDLKNDDFKICVQNMKYLKQTPERILSKCSSYSERNRIVSKRFVDCIGAVELTGLSGGGILEFCSNEQNLSAISTNGYGQCLKSLENAGVKHRANQFGVCANQDSQQIAIQNPKCFVESLSSTYKNYFLYSALTSANAWSSEKNLYYFLNRDCRGEGRYQTYGPNPYLNLVKELNIHTYEGMMFNKDFIQVGGFSALSYDPQTEDLYMLSDETFMSTKLPPRMYVYHLNKELELRDRKVMTFTFNPPAGEQEPDIDPEGLARLSNGSFIVSSEIGANEFRKLENKKTLITNLNIFSPTGSYISSIALPENYKAKYIKRESGGGGGFWSSGSPREENVANGGNNGFIRVNGLFNGGGGFFNGGGNGGRGGGGNMNPPPVTVTYQLTAGLEFNKSIESLSVSPDEKFLFVANESALVQDQQVRGKCRENNNNGAPREEKKEEKRERVPGDGAKKDSDNENSNSNWGNSGSSGYWLNGVWTSTSHQSCGKIVRIVKYTKDDSAKNPFKYASEYKYELEPEVDNGLSEILAISGNKILTLERSWDSSKQKVTARIYRVELKDEAIIPTEMKSVNQIEKHPSLPKTLVLDLDTVISKLSNGFHNIDNFEGMAMGPVLKNGKRSLLLVSDNNFSTKQRTVFLVFEANDALFE